MAGGPSRECGEARPPHQSRHERSDGAGVGRASSLLARVREGYSVVSSGWHAGSVCVSTLWGLIAPSCRAEPRCGRSPPGHGIGAGSRSAHEPVESPTLSASERRGLARRASSNLCQRRRPRCATGRRASRSGSGLRPATSAGAVKERGGRWRRPPRLPQGGAVQLFAAPRSPRGGPGLEDQVIHPVDRPVPPSLSSAIHDGHARDHEGAMSRPPEALPDTVHSRAVRVQVISDQPIIRAGLYCLLAHPDDLARPANGRRTWCSTT